MKKKIISLAVAAALALSMGTTAFAANSKDKNVTATYSGSSSTSVYSVDVSWGSMAFTYTAPAEGTWNPSTHAYDGAGTEGTWSCDEANGANKITVTNHSNAAIKAELNYTPSTGYTGIEGTFGKSALNLATAEGTTVANAPSDSTTLNLTGALAETTGEVTVGKVTVTIKDSTNASVTVSVGGWGNGGTIGGGEAEEVVG